jgi:hypothetical protein
MVNGSGVMVLGSSFRVANIRRWEKVASIRR